MVTGWLMIFLLLIWGQNDVYFSNIHCMLVTLFVLIYNRDKTIALEYFVTSIQPFEFDDLFIQGQLWQIICPSTTYLFFSSNTYILCYYDDKATVSQLWETNKKLRSVLDSWAFMWTGNWRESFSFVPLTHLQNTKAFAIGNFLIRSTTYTMDVRVHAIV